MHNINEIYIYRHAYDVQIYRKINIYCVNKIEDFFNKILKIYHFLHSELRQS